MGPVNDKKSKSMQGTRATLRTRVLPESGDLLRNHEMHMVVGGWWLAGLGAALKAGQKQVWRSPLVLLLYVGTKYCAACCLSRPNSLGSLVVVTQPKICSG